MTDPRPDPEPHDSGLLDVGDGNHVHWETSGNPEGTPVVLLHGGPGQGTSPRMRRAADPERFRIVLVDQRGCGRSTPHAADVDTDMSVNTTEHLLADLELLRAHLGIDRWLLTGGSWGSTLAFAYAERHPERVSAIVLSAITTTRRSEVDWLYRGVGRFFPREWERFRDGVPESERARVTAAEGAGALLAEYVRMLDDPDPAVREHATREWAAWEDAVMGGEPGGDANPFSDKPGRDLAAMVRICAHYFANGAWLEEGALIRDAARMADIPAVLVHGRLDLGGPLETAWEMVRNWPAAELVVLEGAGHQGGEQRRAVLSAAFDRFAAL
ncbi:prolyl aminopeptidase [Pseudonocardia humida]|uniref:Proline iminopeptidase n=1 Tax=Pseudonocardia humida TaxID=2800819 RepID=A0ABT1A428_9PSEU|nr:prolyl aminopeptidase [Pseudonocardia humida]MCO1657767.1 prolyl aminopeptidase [Pseudonocardia humida]